jgi:hypothetical protein
MQPGDTIHPMRPSFHRECLIRLAVGPAAHILKECSCYGGTRHDPPKMSKREAAKLAAQAWDVYGNDPS